MKGKQKAAAVLFAVLSAAVLTACGGSGKESPASEKSAEVSVSESASVEASKEESSTPAAPVKDAEFGQGLGFVIDIPAGYTFNKDMYYYESPDKKAWIWSNDGSVFEKKSNFDDAMALIKAKPKKVADSPYVIYAVEDPSDTFYGIQTHYFIDFNGRYPDIYGAKVTVSNPDKDPAPTETKEILDCVMTVRKKGEPVDWKKGEGSAESQEASGSAQSSEAAAEKKSPLESLKLDYSPEQTARMSMFTRGGSYAFDGDTFYGLNYNSKGDPELVTFPIEKEGDFAKAGEYKILAADTMPQGLTLLDGTLYYVSDAGLASVGTDGTNPKTLIPAAYDYFQLVDGIAYYCDKDYRFYRSDLEGKNAEKLLDKEVYFPYVVAPDWILYQDDADGETLHLYQISTKTDIKVTGEPSQTPIISGKYLFYTAERNGLEVLARIDLGSAKAVWDDSQNAFQYTFPTEYGDKQVRSDLFITYDGQIFCGSSQGWALDQWKQAENTAEASSETQEYSGKEYSVYITYEGGNVKDLYLLRNDTGGSQTLPRMD